MPTVTMPDGTAVDMPDDITPEMGARLRAFADSQKAAATRQVTPPMQGVLGVHKGPQNYPDTGTKISDTVRDMGGIATDQAAKVFPAPVAGAIGTVVDLLPSAIPIGGGAVAGGKIAEAAAPAAKRGAQWMMQSALKPTYEQLRTGKAAKAIDTLLENGINATEGGVKVLKDRIADLNSQVQGAIASSAGVVNKSEVSRTIGKALQDFKYQANNQSDLGAITKSWEEFKDTWFPHGDTISVQDAQKIKSGTYKSLGDKPYGELSGAQTEAQKSIARGLKEGIEKAEPQVIPLNAEQSQLINALKVTERRAILDMNKNPASLALLAHNPAGFAAFMADKSALFKSLVARMLNSSAAVAKPVGQVAGASAGATMSPAVQNQQ